MQISYRLGHQKWGERQPERIPTLQLFIDELGVEYYIDLDELAEALKPFLKEKPDDLRRNRTPKR